MKEVRRLSLRVLRDHEIRSLYVDFRNRPSEHESLIEVTIVQACGIVGSNMHIKYVHWSVELILLLSSSLLN